MGRGLYGQSEFNPTNVADQNRFDDVHSEAKGDGTVLQNGSLTEKGWRQEMAIAEGLRINAEKKGRRADDKSAETYRRLQMEALQLMGERAEDMVKAGFSQTLRDAALNAAGYLAYNSLTVREIVNTYTASDHDIKPTAIRRKKTA